MRGAEPMSLPWEPLFDDLRAARAPDVLHEDVTSWLRNPLAKWVEARIKYHDHRGSLIVRAQVLEDIETSCQLQLDWSRGSYTASESLTRALQRSPRAGLEVANFLLSMDLVQNHVARRLDELLTQARSVWEVVPPGGGRPRRLQRRVAQEVAARYDLVAQHGEAGQHLGLAWSEMYGRDPNPSVVYAESVKAVEFAAKPMLTPNDPKHSLGKMIRAFKDKPTKWNVPLGATPDQGRQMLLEMMAALWDGHGDRHAPEAGQARQVSPEAAEAALHAAVTLVHLFSAKVVTAS